MAFNIDQWLDELDSKLDISGVYESDHYDHEWQKTDSRWRGYTPFTPKSDQKSGTRFYLFPDTLRWHDPSAQMSGSRPIHYVWHVWEEQTGPLTGDDFVRICKLLGEIADHPFPALELTPEQKEEISKMNRRREMLGAVVSFAHEHLKTSQDPEAVNARAYLASRSGVTLEVIEEFKLGLMPSPVQVAHMLFNQGCDIEDAIALGVIKESKNSGDYYSLLTGYVIAPWYDARGNILNIYGRYPLPKAKLGKIVQNVSLSNPTGLELKVKSSLLMMDRVRAAKLKQVTIVEGLFDAIVAQAQGDHSVVACVGSTISAEQYEGLKIEGIETVTICLDPDSSGDKCTPGIVSRLAQHGIKSFVAPRLPDGKDPDDYITENGLEAWETLKSQAESGFRFLAKNIIKTSCPTGKPTDLQVAEMQRNAENQLNRMGRVEPAIAADIDKFFWGELEAIGVNRVGTKQSGSTAAMAPTEVLNRVRLLLTSGLHPSTEQAELEALRKVCGYASQAFENLVNQTNEDILLSAKRSGDNAATAHIYAAKRDGINPYDVFPVDLADAITQQSNLDRQDPMFYIQNLLACTATLIDAKTLLTIKQTWQEPAILWLLTVAHSGTGKTPAQQALLKPIFDRQIARSEEHQASLSEYNTKLRRWRELPGKERAELHGTAREPKELKDEVTPLRKYTVDVVEMATLLRILSTNDTNPVCWVKDEFGQFVKSLDQYKSGKGDSMSMLLQLWNGGYVSVDRKGETGIDLKTPRLSILGNIQPDRTRDVFADSSDATGWQARFLFAVPQLRADSDEFFEAPCLMPGVVERYYSKLENMKLGDVHMSVAAKEVWKGFFKTTMSLRNQNFDSDPAWANYLSKSVSHCARIALVLHHLEQCNSPKENANILQAETLKRAIVAITYYLNQFKLLTTLNNPEISLSTELASIHDYSERSPGGLTAAKLSASHIGKKLRDTAKAQKQKLTVSVIRDLFQQLVAEGMGEIAGEGSETTYRPFPRHQIEKMIKAKAIESGETINAFTEIVAIGETAALSVEEDNTSSTVGYVAPTPDPDPEPTPEWKEGDIVGVKVTAGLSDPELYQFAEWKIRSVTNGKAVCYPILLEEAEETLPLDSLEPIPDGDVF